MSKDDMEYEFAARGEKFGRRDDIEADLESVNSWQVFYDAWRDYLIVGADSAGRVEPSFSGRDNLKVFSLLSATIESIAIGDRTDVAPRSRYTGTQAGGPCEPVASPSSTHEEQKHMQSEVIYEFLPSSPRQFRSCHASTILPLSDGRLLAAWFGGTHENHPDVGIWSSCRDETGGWSHPEKIADETHLPHWNPVLVDAKGAEIILYYKVGPNPREWWTRTKRSSDSGLTWAAHTEPPPLSDRRGRSFTVGPVKNKLIELSDGTWLAPTSRETGNEWDAAATRSTDRGRTWQLSTVPLDHATFAGKGVIQPTAWESEPRRVHMLLRSSAGFVARTDSSDAGRTWSPVESTALPNNNSGIDLVRLPEGALLLCSNPVGADWGSRTPLVLNRSDDNGRNWRQIATLEDERDRDGAGSAEFSYPAIVNLGDDLIVSYTWKRERIRLATVRGVR